MNLHIVISERLNITVYLVSIDFTVIISTIN